jgi:hypothetical protein
MKQYTYFVQDPASKAYAPILTAYSDGDPTAEMIEGWFTAIKIQQQNIGIPRPTFYTVVDMLEVPVKEKAIEVPKNGHGTVA